MSKSNDMSLKIDLLKNMHEVIRSLNDENAYDDWITNGVPDEPSVHDFISIASDDESYVACKRLFSRLIMTYHDSGYYP